MVKAESIARSIDDFIFQNLMLSKRDKRQLNNTITLLNELTKVDL